MFIQHNYLRKCRRDSTLEQSDIASLLKLPNKYSVMRCEKGLKKSSIEILLLYHILFAIPIESIFERQKDQLLSMLSERIRHRIDELKARSTKPKIASRIAFLEATLKKLAANKS